MVAGMEGSEHEDAEYEEEEEEEEEEADEEEEGGGREELGSAREQLASEGEWQETYSLPQCNPSLSRVCSSWIEKRSRREGGMVKRNVSDEPLC